MTVTLEQSYARCRELNRRHGTTYYWSTRALPTVKRHHVHALYAFCRYADEIVDDLSHTPTAGRQEALAGFGERFFTDLAAGDSDDEVLKAVVHTVKAFSLGPDCFRRFLRSMTMDLTVRRYETFDDLAAYMDGSAAVIGEMLVPILEPQAPRALTCARQLGVAFQLTNFLRDVGEDLDRGRVYLPQDDVRRFGAEAALADRRVTPEWVALMRFEIERTRGFYADAADGPSLLAPSSRPCVVAARTLYGRILDRIERAGYDVFTSRVRVPLTEKATVVARLAAPALARGAAARVGHRARRHRRRS